MRREEEGDATKAGGGNLQKLIPISKVFLNQKRR